MRLMKSLEKMNNDECWYRSGKTGVLNERFFHENTEVEIKDDNQVETKVETDVEIKIKPKFESETEDETQEKRRLRTEI